ncbi:hypothetical protein UFOVP995_33 [uncultured Caudovirales phage]|uniref:Uncharacterized protein n=1 Tax=uncultured Caudovirales phage TaxID=2100421 RepID=A0A6J5QA57_9CAUD|nr:hypothetical protein UFOVP995_33 [uncultured Caudovirales phage]
MQLLITHQSISWLHFELEIHRWTLYINLCHRWDKWLDGSNRAADNVDHVNKDTEYSRDQEVPEQLCIDADSERRYTGFSHSDLLPHRRVEPQGEAAVHG